MRASIWLVTFAINTLLIALLFSGLWRPFGLPVAAVVFPAFLAYAVLTLFFLKCPVCRTVTSGWWISGEGFFSIYFFAPFANPGRCSRCSLSFHRNTFWDDFRADRRQWRRDNP